jgi:antitoxin MazE
MKELELSIGDKVKVLVQNQKIILEPIKKERPKFDINELVKQIPTDYTPKEEISDKTGKELW